MTQIAMPGAIALVGSGEYTMAMNQTDAALLATLDSARPRAVALIPTASALEPGKPEEWNAKGVAHFAALGVAATSVLLLNRDDAEAAALADTLDRHSFFYFSGGNPEYLVETLHGTAAWRTIVRQHQAGAVVAGCSAGAMMLGGYILSIRALRQGQSPRWRAALGVVPGVAVLPHFDRMRQWLAEAIDAVLAAAPPDATVVGVDEDTALVYLPQPGGAGEWRVHGRQTVTVFNRSGAPNVYGVGELVPLSTPIGAAAG